MVTVTEPNLRFSDFNGRYLKKRLVDVAELQRGFDLPSAHRVKGKIPIISSGGVSGWHNEFKVEAPGVVMGRYGSIGEVFFIEDNFWPLNTSLWVKDFHGNNPKYSYYLLSRIDYKKFSDKTGVPGVNRNDLHRIKVSLPRKAEQLKVADFLTSVDTKIQQLKRKHTLMQQYKKGVMQQLFSQRLRFKDDRGKDYPEWKSEPLGNVFFEVKDKVGSQEIETYSITAGTGFISQKSKFGKDISGEQNAKYIALKNGQFSYNKGNSKSYKYGCVYQNRENKTIGVPNVFISFDLRDKEMSKDFFEHLFVDHYLDRHLRRLISSSARMDGLLNVNKTYFFEIPVPIPSNDEQKKIGLFLNQLDKKIEQLNHQITQTEAFKKGLLQQMFV